MIQIKIISFLDSLLKSLLVAPVKVLYDKEVLPSDTVKIEKVKTSTIKKSKTHINRKVMQK